MIFIFYCSFTHSGSISAMEVIYICTHHLLLKRATLLVLKVLEEIFHDIQSRITASSNIEYIAVSFKMDFTVRKSFEGFFFFIILQFKEPFTSRYSKK